MIYSRILTASCICFFIAACDKQEQATAAENKTEIKTEIKTTPEKITTGKTRPPLNLSIDKIPVEHKNKNDINFVKDKEHTEQNTALLKILSKDKTEANINLSGKLLTDENKLEDKEYLDSVDGIQINIEGNFD